MTTMRAKMRVSLVTEHKDPIKEGNPVTAETLGFSAVGPSNSYPADGSDENNTFARWTPSAQLNMCVNNPALLGQFKVGDTFYVDFTPCDRG